MKWLIFQLSEGLRGSWEDTFGVRGLSGRLLGAWGEPMQVLGSQRSYGSMWEDSQSMPFFTLLRLEKTLGDPGCLEGSSVVPRSSGVILGGP